MRSRVAHEWCNDAAGIFSQFGGELTHTIQSTNEDGFALNGMSLGRVRSLLHQGNGSYE